MSKPLKNKVLIEPIEAKSASGLIIVASAGRNANRRGRVIAVGSTVVEEVVPGCEVEYVPGSSSIMEDGVELHIVTDDNILLVR